MVFRFILLLVAFQVGLAGCSSNKGKSTASAPANQKKLSIEDKNELKNELKNQREIYDTEKKFLDGQISADSATLESSQKMLNSFTKMESSTKIMKSLCADHKSEQNCIDLKVRMESQEKYAKGKAVLTQKVELIRDDYEKAKVTYKSAFSSIQEETKSLTKDGITATDAQPTSIMYSHSEDFLNKKLLGVNHVIESYENIEKLCLQFSSETIFSQACANGGTSELKKKFVSLKATIEERLVKLEQEKHAAAFETEKVAYFKSHTEASVVFAGSYTSYLEIIDGDVDVSPIIGSYRIENIIKFIKKSILDFDARDAKFDPGSASLNAKMLAFKNFIKKCENPAYVGQVGLIALKKTMDQSNIDQIYTVFIHTDYNDPLFKNRLGNFKLEWYRNFDLANSTSVATRFKGSYAEMKSAGLANPAVLQLFNKFVGEIDQYTEAYKFGIGLPFP